MTSVDECTLYEFDANANDEKKQLKLSKLFGIAEQELDIRSSQVFIKSKTNENQTTEFKSPSVADTLKRIKLSKIFGPDFTSPNELNSLKHVYTYHLPEALQKKQTKISQILGSHFLVDIPLSEILENGLDALLNSRIPLTLFLVYLLQRHSAELLFFYLDVEEFKHKKYNDNDKVIQYDAAVRIFSMYLSKDSVLEINVEANIFNTTKELIDLQDNLSECFDQAEEHILSLLRQNFAEAKSCLFEDYQETVKLESVVITDSTLEWILDLIKPYSYEQDTTPEDSKSNAVILKLLVNQFCASRLK
ncbi:RGS domain-containing protein [Globomyces pollinis-pini]|nr:RGS domain-containing protein [Globomyces pollinis-pini]